MTTQLSDAFGIDVVDQIRALTGGITDSPALAHARWESLVRRAAEADTDIARIVARVDRRTSLQGLARRYAGEAARSDQHPGLREVIDRLVQGNGGQPSADDIDRAVDAAAAWSYRTRHRSQVIQVACDLLPSRLGISDRRWASQSGPAKHPESTGMVPVDPFARWCRLAAASGDVDALVQASCADGVAIDLGLYNGEHPPVPTNSAPTNTVRLFTWLVPPRDRDSRSRATVLIRAPQWRDALSNCSGVAATVAQIAAGSVLLSVS